MTKFNDLNLDEKVLKAVAEAGYESPTPIQAAAIPHAIMGKDVLGIAQTGTGKTASFTLPMITILAQGRARARMPRSLILCPTRELAAQVAENFENYGKYHKLSMALLIGGVSFKDQDRLIDRGVDVLIATPGRLLDHFERGKLMLTGVQVMVVDEADRMLDMGFIPDLERIFKLTPFTRQTLFFSATMAPEITRITEEFLHNPVRVEVARAATTSENITQVVCEQTPSRRDRAAKEKRALLRALMMAEGDGLKNAIIFCNRKVDVDIVAKSLKKHGLDANPIHGDLDQSARMRILNDFRDGNLKFLVASDVAARGLDIPAVSHVFNFDVPIHAEDYVHRIGRTGRAGLLGKAITLCQPANKKHIDAIEELVETKIDRIENPLAKPATAITDAAAPTEVTAKEKPERSRAPRKPREEPQKHASTRRNSERRSDNRRGPVGMGDHMPAFLTREFLPMPEEKPKMPIAAPEAAEAEDTTPQATTPAEKPKRKPRKKAAPKLESVKVEEAPAEAVAEEKPEKRRTRTKAQAPSPDAPAEAAPAKPKRKRRTKAEMAAARTAAEAAGEPLKPKRKPRKKATPKVEEAPGSEAPATETPATETPTEAPTEPPKKRPRITAPAPTSE